MIKARGSGSKVYLYFMKKGRQARHRIPWNSCFLFRNSPKNLDPSYKMDLDFGCRKGKICIGGKFHRTDLVICSHSRERKTQSYS